ncbi:unnamed protein product [Protopolystoma xenopodis]|uniref:Helix-turn-helix domain-containing protein n=1 Tax=Protopolystoma xenopodis TaxID=117903 RepID=A0A3S5FFS9_9PLAT|nr:unnamed protein product [Protopolystoma xenopodis]
MRYQDGYFTLWSCGREKLEEFLKLVNQIDETVTFTMEVEESERLPFLDVEVICSNGMLKQKLFRKKSSVGIILNFRSHHNYGLKMGIMRSMIIRSLRLADVEFWDEKLDKSTRILLGNGYPIEVIHRSIPAVKIRWQDGDYERTVRTMKDSQKWICLLSCEYNTMAEDFGQGAFY